MRDKVVFLVNGSVVENIMSYSIDSDLFMAADAFSFSLIDPVASISAGMQIEARVNNEKEFVGIIDNVEYSANKKGRALNVGGRDLMGVLCDHGITEFGTEDLGGRTLRSIAQTVMRDVPFNLIKNVVYEGNSARLDIPMNTVKSEPGQTIFALLKACAKSRGLHFWCREDGSLVFGTPITKGPIDYRFSLSAQPNATDCLEGKKVHDITEGFSKIYVHCQSQDGDDDVVNFSATASLRVPQEFPFYKPRVVQVDGDSRSPALEARRLLNIARAKTEQYHYTVAGHSQYSQVFNYKTNRVAHVEDFLNDVHGDFLVAGRTFSLKDKKSGPQTQIRLCRLGVPVDA